MWSEVLHMYSGSVTVFVVHVRKMRVAVLQCPVDMAVTMAGTGRHRRVMGMVVMGIVAMVVGVLVAARLVHMGVLMALGQVQPYPQQHQGTGQGELGSDRLLQQGDGQQRAEKGGYREVGTSTCRPQVA